MPLGSFRINGIAKRFAVTVEAEVIRRKVGVSAFGDAKVSTAQSQFGGASAVFDGSGDFLELSDSPTDFGTNDFTVESYFRYSGTTGGFRPIIDTREAVGPSGFFLGIDSSNKPVYFINSASRITAADAISTNTWYHLALVRSNGVSKLYIDGTQVGSDYTDTNDFTTTLSRISRNYLNTGFWNGHLDEVRISNTARYTSNFTPSTTPFVNDENTLLLLHMDGTNNSTVFEDDNGVRGKRGITAIGDAKVSTAQSQFGGSSAIFDGNGDYLDLYNVNDINLNNNFTIEFWWRATNATSSGLVPFFDTATHLFYMGFVSSVKYYIFRKSTSTNIATSSDIAVANNTWYHKSIVKSGSTVTIYHNGVNVWSSSIWSETISVTNGSTWIGRYLTSFLNGNIDEFRISNTARYTANFTPSTVPFVNDANTLLLLHMDGTNNSTYFEDDNGVRAKKSPISINGAAVSTTQSQFGGSSATFPNATSAIILEQLLPSTSNDFTIEMWFRGDWSGDNPSLPLQVFHQLTTPNGFSISIGTSRVVTFFYRDVTNTSVSTTTAVSKATWYHYAVSRQGSLLKVFLNGIEENSAVLDIFVPGEIGTTIGNASGLNRQFFGHIDEVRVSNVARYTANFTPATSPFQNDANTLLLLHMDGTNNSTVFTDDNGVAPDHDYGA